VFTQSMPALAQALSGALPEAALKQLMQSLGNCQQPLTHRGAINILPPDSTGVGGLARPGTWRASDYTNIMPQAGDNAYVDVAGNIDNSQHNTTNTLNTNNYGGNSFSFPLNNKFNYTNYYGGDTFNVAGNSNFDNSTHTTLKAGDLFVSNLFVNNVYNNYNNGGGDGGGGGDNGGGMGGGGPGGPGVAPPQVPVPASTQVSTFLKDVSGTGNVICPTVSSAKIKDANVSLTKENTSIDVTVTGSVSVPVAKSGSLAAIKATGTIDIPTVTGGTLTGATASGPVTYDTYPTATCGSLSGTVSVPTSGTFTGTPTGIAVTGGLGTLTGTVSVPTGGYLDASCKLVLTYENKTVNLTGAPSVSVTSQGSVSGAVTLSGSASTPVTITAPSITLTKSSVTVTPTFNVSGGTFKAATTNSSQAVTVTTAAATVTITNANEGQPFSATGSISVPGVKSAALADSTVDLTAGTTDKKVTLKLAKKSDFIVYLRPRI